MVAKKLNRKKKFQIKWISSIFSPSFRIDPVSRYPPVYPTEMYNPLQINISDFLTHLNMITILSYLF